MEHGGVGTPHSQGASGTVLGAGVDEVGLFFWRSRAQWLVGSSARWLVPALRRNTGRSRGWGESSWKLAFFIYLGKEHGGCVKRHSSGSFLEGTK